MSSVKFLSKIIQNTIVSVTAQCFEQIFLQGINNIDFYFN